MKKKEYLPFHAKTLLTVSKEAKKELYWAFCEETKTNEITTDYYHRRKSNTKLETESDFLEALNGGAKPDSYSYYTFKKEYLNKVILSGSEDKINFFVKNNKSLIGEYDLSIINSFIPTLDEKTIFNILMNGSNTFGMFNHIEFEKTISLLKNHSQATNILSSYVAQREKTINTEYEWLGIRNKILENFPNKLNEFISIPIVKEYLDSLNKKPESFIETDIVETIYLRLNCEQLQKACPLPFGTFKFYTRSLKTLIKSFEKSGVEAGVVKVHINDSIPDDIGYQYTHIYINKNEKSNLSKEDIKEIIFEYYGEYLKTINQIDLATLEPLTEKWIKTKLLYNSINKDIAINEPSTKKTVKI